MKVLIVGCCGFIGSNLINHLSAKHEVIGVDNLQFGNLDNLENTANFNKLDFARLDEWYLNRFDVLIHVACANIIYAQNYQVETFKTNALETINLFQRFKGRIIYTSTASIYGGASQVPTNEDYPESVSNAYDQSKLIAERYLQLRGNYTTLRLSNVYGVNQRPDNPYAGVIGKFIQAGIKDEPMLIYGDGLATRDYTYISDVVEAIEMSLNVDALNTEINIAGNSEISIVKLAYTISNILGKEVNMDFIEPRKIDKIHRRWLYCAKAKELLGWEPKVKLNEGLKKTIEWMINEY